MQLVFHTGAHLTEDERLTSCLLRNRDLGHARRVIVPEPHSYTKLLSDIASGSYADRAAEKARADVLNTIIEDAQTDRLILSDANFFGKSRSAFHKGQIYPKAPERLSRLAQIFQQDDIEIFMALRNPATFLPAIFQTSPLDGLVDFLGGFDPRTLRWSELLVKIQKAVPNASITVWCNEDAPIIWPQIIRQVLDETSGKEIVGELDVLHDIMRPDGMKRLNAYLAEHRDMTETQIRRVMLAFLDKFAIDAEIEQELDMPGWTEDLVSEMTAIYEEDILAITRMPDVTLITY